MNLTEFLNNLKIELHDVEEEIYTPDELTRGLNKSLSLMSRLIPKRSMIADTIATAMFVSDHILDISSILSDYIKIDKVEYPIDESPQTYPTCDVVDGNLIFRTAQSFVDGDGIRLFYQKAWTPPTSITDGDYPSHLNDALLIGSSGQVLLYRAEKFMQDSVTRLDEASTAIDLIVAITLPTAPVITTEITAINNDIASSRDALVLAISTLTSMDTFLATNVGDRITSLNSQLSLGSNYLANATSLVNTGTRGSNVGEIFGQYGDISANLAQGHSKAGDLEIARAAGYESKSARLNAVSGNYINTAVQSLSLIARKIELYATQLEANNTSLTYYTKLVDKATISMALSKQYLDIAGRYLASGQAKINEFLTSMGFRPEFKIFNAASEQRE